ncbi:MAG: chemotaxis protein CheW [Polaromonas sp.]
MQNDTYVNIDTFIPFMRDVMRCEGALSELSLTWRLIEASAKMNCPEEVSNLLPMMTATREGFHRLESDLVTSLVRESLTSAMAEIGTSAHHLIDIVVRNLYERTADVGFLATDLELSRFVAGLTDNRGDIITRLREYRNKYTVYDEIMLLDVQGNVLAQIDEESPVEGCRDQLVANTLASNTYVETFRATDLRPGQTHALIYSHRILHPQSGEVVGVLCLSFGFHREMDGLFDSRTRGDGHSIALLVDAEQRVLASGDPLWIPVGATVPSNPQGTGRLMVYSGRAYLVQTVAAQGYQGYPGPTGWRGQVMIPVELAFTAQVNAGIAHLDPAISMGLLSHAATFCPPLHAIVAAAQTIRRVVWNGQAVSSGQNDDQGRIKAVLEQIGETGARTNQLFTQAIQDLYATVLSASMHVNESLSRLLVDLLERNLYERANDCRWWALSPTLRDLLNDPVPRTQALVEASRVLAHIKSLYTVYENLVVYDRGGRIVATSRPEAEQRDEGASLLGQTLDAETWAAVQALQGSQSYHVSPWQASHWYGGRPTFIYHAAIRAPGTAHEVLGGIGIVFNAAQEFDAMLRGTVAGKLNTHALFVNRHGRVLASTDPGRPAGPCIDLPAEVLALPAGQSLSRVLVQDGCYCVLGASASSGYREFKVSDGYAEDVLALSYESFGAVQADAPHAVQRRSLGLLTDAKAGPSREMATFFVGSTLYAVDATCVQEALPAHAIAPVSVERLPYCRGTLPRKENGVVSSYVWVFDLGQLLRGKPSEITPHSQVIVLRYGDTCIGLLVSELHEVTTFAFARITPVPTLSGRGNRMISELIHANAGRLLVQCIDPQALMAVLGQPAKDLSDLIPLAAGIEVPDAALEEMA